MNKFYEFNNCEYYALIVAKNMDDAIEEYMTDVADLDEGYNPAEITIDEVKERLNKVYKCDVNVLIENYKNIGYADLVLIDGSLL